MKKRLIMVLAVILSLSVYVKAKGSELTSDPFTEPTIIRCTCYTDVGITASGSYTRPYIIAGRKEWLGYVAGLYAINEDGSIGEFIGYYEFKDTGAGIDTDGDGKGDSIINGTSVDVWVTDSNAVKEWQTKYGDYVYIKIIKGVG